MEWSKESKTHVSTMKDGDFYGSEKSVVLTSEDDVKIVHTDASGNQTVLKESTKLEVKEVIDASVMSKKALREFLAEEIKDAKEKDVLFSVTLEGNHDESFRSCDFWSCCNRLFKEFSINTNQNLIKLV